MGSPDVRITVNGRRAFTYNLAAEKHGMTPDAVRMVLKRAGVREIDGARLERLPLYYATEVSAALKARPGRGAPGVSRPHRSSAQR